MSGVPVPEAPGWSVLWSRSQKREYFFNKTTGQRVWKDSSLPRGWGLGPHEEGQWTYIHLATGRKTTARPTEDSSGSDSAAPGSSPSTATRKRHASPAAGDGSHAPPPKRSRHSEAAPTRIRIPMRLPPQASASWPKERPESISWPELLEKSPLFGRPHKTVLSQLIRPHVARVFDVGAGVGHSTRYIAGCASRHTNIVAIDAWTPGLAGHMLRAVGLDDIAAAHDAIADPFSFFCSHLWDISAAGTSTRLLMRRGEIAAAIHGCHLAGFPPDVVYYDADLDAARCEAVLDQLMTRYPQCHIAGGGYDYSPGVRQAVVSLSQKHNRPLHVEEGRCWTFSPSEILVTRNDSARGPSASQSVVSGKTTVDGPAWVHAVARAMETGEDDAEAVRELCRGHGRDPRRAREADAQGVTEPGALPGEDPDTVLVDSVTRDKRCLSALMRATKMKRIECMRCLMHEFGARVNVQAPRSLYTALHAAAYDGFEEGVRELMAAGARRTLKNRHGETASEAASASGRAAIATLIDTWGDATPSAGPGE